MICNDCQKSFTGTGMRCIRCNDLFERGRTNQAQAVKQVFTCSKEMKRCRATIYLAASIATVNFIGAVTIWWLYIYNSKPCTNLILLDLMKGIDPISLAIQAIVIIGVALKSRVAAILLLAGHCFQLVMIAQKVGEKGLHTWPLITVGIYLATIYQCFRWHYLKNKIQQAL
jgi:hypothetical protein